MKTCEKYGKKNISVAREEADRLYFVAVHCEINNS